MSSNTSLWKATVNEQKNRLALQGETDCDVVIIGGGLTGLATAYFLQLQGVKTITLEKDKIGNGASGLNGGAVLARIPNSLSTWSQGRTMDETENMLNLAIDSVDLLESIVKKHHISCDFTKKGDFSPAFKPAHLEGMKKEHEFLEKTMKYYDTKIIEKSEMHKEINTDFYHGGIVNERSSHIHPLKFVLGLADIVEELGGSIYENTEALSRHKNATNKMEVITNKGKVVADHVVIGTNGYSGDFSKLIKKSVVPVESIMIATEPLTKKVMEETIVNNRVVSDSKRLLYYFKRTADNRLTFGGSGRASNKMEQMNLFKNLRKGMIHVFPQLKDAEIEYQWGGKIGYTWDSHPYIGQLDDGAYFSVGYCGRGVALSQMMGKILSKAIVNNEKLDSPFYKEKLKPIPFHSQYAKAVGMVKFYKRFQDKFF